MALKSDVYWQEEKTGNSGKRRQALKNILQTAQPFVFYKKDEIVPVKLTIGDTACTHHLNPELVKILVSEIKKTKAKPFLFDTNVMYRGGRTNAVDHLNLAQTKGFGHTRVGAPFIIADGVFGQDGKEYEVDSPVLKKIRVPSFVGMLESVVVVSHITGHILSGYAGAMKNVAMGFACRSTKQVQHSSAKPHIIEKRCVKCGCCIAICPAAAITMKGEKAFIDQNACVGCAECLCACKFDAVFLNWQEDAHIFVKRMAEVAAFVLGKFKQRFFVNFAFDITKECDCISNRDEKCINPDIGVLASSDIVSLEKATMDMLAGNAHPYLKAADELSHVMLEYAAAKGLGNLEYNLIKIER